MVQKHGKTALTENVPLAVTSVATTGIRKIVELLDHQGIGGFCRVRLGGFIFFLRMTDLTPLNELAKKILKR